MVPLWYSKTYDLAMLTKRILNYKMKVILVQNLSAKETLLILTSEINISSSRYPTEMFLYSKQSYGHQSINLLAEP